MALSRHPVTISSEQFDDGQFQNYCKCMLALNMTKKALCAVVERKWKLFISKLPENERDHLETFVHCLGPEKKTRVLVTGMHIPCCHTLCENMRLRLLALLDDPSRPYDISLDEALSSDNCLRYFWDIAKLFIFEENILMPKRKLFDLDTLQLIAMMQNCKLFAFDSYDQVLSQTCDDRKYLIHARKNKMTEQEMTYLFTRMKLLLAKFHGVKFSICTDTVDDLRQLQQKDLTNEFQPIEFKLLVKKIFEIKKEALEADMVVSDDDIDKSNLEDLLKETNHVLEQIEELLDEHEVDDEDELILENKNLKELVERLKGEIDQLKSEELLDNKEEDDVDELRLENQNLHELVKSLKDEIKQLKSENLPVMEESSMLEPEEVTDVGQEMNDMKRQLEWFKSELMNSRATVKRLEKERNRYRKALEDADELTSSMETTAGGFTILSEKSILYGQKVTVLQGNIVRVTADAIAHPTGKNFETRGAVGSELKEAGGEVFLHEVTSLRNTHGPLAISEAAICKGNNFPAEYVIHVHSPGWRHENAQQMLTTATANVLKLADEHNMKSIGIPSISSGHAGFPKLIAAKTILSAITDYFSSNRFSSIRQVFFVLFDAESVTAYITQLQQLDV